MWNEREKKKSYVRKTWERRNLDLLRRSMGGQSARKMRDSHPHLLRMPCRRRRAGVALRGFMHNVTGVIAGRAVRCGSLVLVVWWWWHGVENSWEGKCEVSDSTFAGGGWVGKGLFLFSGPESSPWIEHFTRTSDSLLVVGRF